MRRHVPAVSEMDNTVRMLYRSTHIYILAAALVNIGVGSYYQNRTGRWQRIVQTIGSIFILVPPLLLLMAFFTEPLLSRLQRPYSRPGVVMLAIGILLHLISGADGTKTSPESTS
jgi:Kef-type K+ transport system membrane component KefB